MIITYKTENKQISTTQSNDDLIIEFADFNNQKTYKVKAKKSLTLVSALIEENVKINKNDVYFLNGYQSWTDTKETMLTEKEKDVKKIPKILTKKFALDKYGDCHIYNYSKNHLHGYDIFYTKGENENFLYNLNYCNAYLIFEINKKTLKLNLISDVENISMQENDEFVVFDYKIFDSLTKGVESFENDFPVINDKKIFGYTSWYNYYQNINEQIMLRDLDSLDSRFELFQIDDGYETFVGDWKDVDKLKFKNGLSELVKKIHQKGFKAGIWLAPFVAEEKSKLFNEHKDYFKKDKNGNFVKCGGNWSGFYALDLENENVVNYIKSCFDFFLNLGFDFFKLDFLYATNTSLYKNQTRCMATNKFYKMLRDFAKDKIILGCGATLINGYKNFDYMRIGPDVSLKFDDTPVMRLLHRERISTKVTLQNTIYRSLINERFFGNDPDVFLLRDDNIDLSAEQKKSLVTINSLFGNVLMTSDNIADYDEQKKQILNSSLYLFLNAKNKKFKRCGDEIKISYTLDEKLFVLTYNTKSGVISNG